MKINRIIDANINRYKEGIRVVEDILRYYFSSPLSKELKSLRHIKIPNYKESLLQRDAVNDILKKTISSEKKRESLEDIVIANFKRAQESARVLEEIFKLIDVNISEEFKKARYSLYSLEKEVIKSYFLSNT